jgi:beta-mannosidase
MDPQRWPDLDWEHLEAHHSLQREQMDRRVDRDSAASFEAWRAATQAYQAELIRFHIETLRRLKYRPTGGFCQFMLADAQPAVSAAVLDHERQPKAGYRAMVDACAPVIVVADRPAAWYRSGERVHLAVHAVSDLRHPIAPARATAVLRWPGDHRTWEFEGRIGADSCTRIGRIDLALPASPGPLHLDLDLTWTADDDTTGRATNHYESELRA